MSLSLGARKSRESSSGVSSSSLREISAIESTRDWVRSVVLVSFALIGCFCSSNFRVALLKLLWSIPLEKRDLQCRGGLEVNWEISPEEESIKGDSGLPADSVGLSCKSWTVVMEGLLLARSCHWGGTASSEVSPRTVYVELLIEDLFRESIWAL